MAEQLKAGKFVQPETYTEATIYISDIVGFTSIASDSNPLEIVKFLNDLYSCFDEIIAKHEVYKVGFLHPHLEIFFAVLQSE